MSIKSKLNYKVTQSYFLTFFINEIFVNSNLLSKTKLFSILKKNTHHKYYNKHIKQTLLKLIIIEIDRFII